MVKTIQLDTLLTLGIGLFFAMWRMEREGAEPFWRQPAYGVGFAYTMMIGVGIAVVCYLVNPSWMWMYWVDPGAIPWWHMAGIFLVGYPASYTFGYLLGCELDKVNMNGTAFFNVLGLIFTAIFITFGRLWAVADFAGFHAGRAKPMIGMSPPSITGLAVVLLIAFPLAFYGLYKAHGRLIE